MVQRRGLDTGRCLMKAIVVTDEAAGTAGMTLVERPEPEPAINDVVVQVHASGFTSGELTWPSTWTDRVDRDRTPSIPGQELAGVVTALGYGTTGLSVGQRVFGLSDSYRGGTLAEYVAVEARNLAPLPGRWSRRSHVSSAPTSSAPDALPTVRRRSTSARRSSSTSRTTSSKTSAASIWCSMSSAATSGSGPQASFEPEESW